jgi:hypothetical protein
VGGYPNGVAPATGQSVTPIPPPVGYTPDAGLFPGQPVGPGGPTGAPETTPPVYPPPGLYGQQTWQSPNFKAYDLGVNSRYAPRVWVNAEYLLWFAKAQPANYPLVTTSAPADGGVLGNISTTTLHSTTDLGYNLFSGFRVSGGFFRDADRRFGWYASGFLLEQKANVFNAGSDATGQPLLARPFINATTGAQTALLVSFPNYASGNVTVYSSNRTWGAEGGPIFNLFRTCPGSNCLWNLDLISGFRYLGIHEALRMESSSTLLSPLGTSTLGGPSSTLAGGATATFDGKLYGPPATIGVIDQFDVQNNFYGGQLGLSSTLNCNRCYFSVTGKVALGVMHEQLDVTGYSTLTSSSPLTYSRVNGGLFANTSNIGRYKHDVFAVVPEVDANIGYNWTSWLTTYVGYSFIYASRTLRPGDQYNPTVNPAVIPTSPSYGLGRAVSTPSALLTQSDFWVQGVNFGLTLRY